MNGKRAFTLGTVLWVLGGAIAAPAQDRPQPPEGPQTNTGVVSRSLGTVKSLTGKTLVLKADTGPDVTVTLLDGTRIMRLAPGQTDLKNATPMTLPEIQVGDRMLVRGRPGDNDTVTAISIVVMKQADVAQKQQHEREDWQRRGAGGIVGAIDPASGVITVSVTPSYSITVKTGKDTGFLRYAPNSVKFAEAQKGTFDQIKVGDQLRARGERSADGKEITAEEVISGTFRNIAGTISSIDAANSAMTVKDVLGKKTVVVKFNADSQLRKLAPPMAQRLAFFLKGGAQSGAGTQPQPAPGAGAPMGGAGNGGGPGPRPTGGPDFQQILSRIPSVALADLQKEDAVMIVAAQGTAGGEVTAITLLAGVEPILTASPNGMSAAALFSGWNLGAPGGDAGPQ
jgi:Domain of unknown function (DUF5666)